MTAVSDPRHILRLVHHLCMHAGSLLPRRMLLNAVIEASGSLGHKDYSVTVNVDKKSACVENVPGMTEAGSQSSRVCAAMSDASSSPLPLTHAAWCRLMRHPQLHMSWVYR
jgi:hypothetical protein